MRPLHSPGLALVSALALLPAACSTPAAAPETPVADAPSTRNPVFAGADPHLAIADGRWWIYPTNSGPALGTSRLYAWSSPDLRTWTRTEAPLITFDEIDWEDDDGAPRHALWAPGVAEKDGRWFLYYSVGPQNPTPSRIGVAVADHPAGPFRDTGAPLITGGDGFEAIDAMVFTDPRTRTSYLYAGGSAGSTLRAWELEPDMVRIRREAPVATPHLFTEGAFMHVRNGVYYLSYSHGRFGHSDYSSHYATAPGPLGPWTYRGRILGSDTLRKGPGHHAIVQNPVNGDWIIAYHRWETTEEPGPYRGSRQVAVQRLFYSPDGLIQPVRMNADPPPSSPLAQTTRTRATRSRAR